VDQATGLHVVDVSDPTRPTQVSVNATPHYASDVAVAGSYAYVADGRCGLRVFDVRDPSEPAEIGRYSTPGLATGIAVHGARAYVTAIRAELDDICPNG
jgi:hypothetical protein